MYYDVKCNVLRLAIFQCHCFLTNSNRSSPTIENYESTTAMKIKVRLRGFLPTYLSRPVEKCRITRKPAVTMTSDQVRTHFVFLDIIGFVESIIQFLVSPWSVSQKTLISTQREMRLWEYTVINYEYQWKHSKLVSVICIEYYDLPIRLESRGVDPGSLVSCVLTVTSELSPLTLQWRGGLFFEWSR